MSMGPSPGKDHRMKTVAPLLCAVYLTKTEYGSLADNRLVVSPTEERYEIRPLSSDSFGNEKLAEGEAVNVDGIGVGIHRNGVITVYRS